MPFDYASIAAVALELVTEFGRTVTLRRLSATPPNPAEPWLPPVDPRAAPAATLEVTAAFVDPSSERELGLNSRVDDWVKRSEQIAIIASPSDLSEFSELVDDDGTTVWRITNPGRGVSTLRPGPTRIVHFLGVAR